MNLTNLNSITNQLLLRGHGDEKVVITLKQPSVGPRSGIGIDFVYIGMDWESNQLRIEPSKDLVLYEKDRDKAMPIKVRSVPNGSVMRKVLTCPKCACHLKKADNYCSSCGQRVSYE